ncbi:Beta-lactamase-like protein 2 homolog [Eumeta japonica]|uniref:Beta-lactamase-like protein 2 homolog n=1 Tax=Eumeta variegata TaxID=151549 RepID=A0A4C1WKH2_EUMVA|nr:Beta-lactamase-like protein 2 homolog [Eumeta japonica]
MAAVIPAVTRLTSRVIRILGCNPSPMTLQGTNTYLIGTGKRRILLDAGDNGVIEYQTHLKSVIESEKVDIEHIILSHWHHDHVGGVEDIYGTLAKNCTVWKHKRSSDDDSDNQLPETIPLQWLKDGQEFKIEGATLKIHHTPGHTTDHVVLSMLEDKILFSGDCILGEGTAVFEDLYTYMQSLQKILELKPSFIYPGHGNILNEPIKTIQYYIEHRNRREEQILDTLKCNPDKLFTDLNLVEAIYTDIAEELYPAAARNVTHHLTKLNKEKKVRNIQSDGECKWQIAVQNKI